MTPERQEYLIKRYWAERGYRVKTWQKHGEFTPSFRTVRRDVRSDMVNGWPREMG